MAAMHRLALALVLVGLAACNHDRAPKPVANAATDPSGEFAPQLFTVDQLREACFVGRVIEYRIAAEGKPTTIEHWEFVAADDHEATIHSITRDEAGKVLEDTTAKTAWDELHKHGQFPAAATTIEDGVSLIVTAGTFQTRLYTVKAGDTVQRFWFAVNLPGPPVQFTTEQGGTEIQRAEMLRAK